MGDVNPILEFQCMSIEGSMLPDSTATLFLSIASMSRGRTRDAGGDTCSIPLQYTTGEILGAETPDTLEGWRT